jgi:hypothetical protein
MSDDEDQLIPYLQFALPIPRVVQFSQDDRGGITSNSGPLAEWLPETWKDLRRRLYSQCYSQARDEYEAVEEEIWDELPENCGLEGWHVLLEQRRVAMA